MECKAGIADNKQWVERLKPCLEWKARIEALEAAAAAVRCACGVENPRVPLISETRRLEGLPGGGYAANVCRTTNNSLWHSRDHGSSPMSLSE